MSDSNVTQLPRPIMIDLDAETRPEEDIKPPFVAKINGREVTMTDPEDLDWRDLLLMEQPSEFLRLSLSPEDRKYLFEQEIPGWRFNKLMDAYYKHYDLEEKQAAARRQSRLAGV